MVLSALEIIAIIFIAISLIKLFIILVNKKTWFKDVVRPVYGNKGISSFIFFVLIIIIFYYLLRELTFTQIFATIALASLLITFSLIQYNKELLPVFERIYDKNLTGSQWLIIILWLILIIVALYEIFLL